MGLASEDFDLGILSPDRNLGYLPKPIPTERDREIGELLLSAVASQRVARLRHCLNEGSEAVLRAFAERMASTSVRSNDPAQLRLGLIALLLSWGRADSRDALTVLPLFHDAILRLSLDSSEFIESVRQVVGDRLAEPFVDFLKRSDKSLASMGYSEGADKDGFRYVRNW